MDRVGLGRQAPKICPDEFDLARFSDILNLESDALDVVSWGWVDGFKPFVVRHSPSFSDADRNYITRWKNEMTSG